MYARVTFFTTQPISEHFMSNFFRLQQFQKIVTPFGEPKVRSLTQNWILLRNAVQYHVL